MKFKLNEEICLYTEEKGLSESILTCRYDLFALMFRDRWFSSHLLFQVVNFCTFKRINHPQSSSIECNISFCWSFFADSSKTKIREFKGEQRVRRLNTNYIASIFWMSDLMGSKWFIRSVRFLISSRSDSEPSLSLSLRERANNLWLHMHRGVKKRRRPHGNFLKNYTRRHQSRRVSLSNYHLSAFGLLKSSLFTHAHTITSVFLLLAISN